MSITGRGGGWEWRQSWWILFTLVPGGVFSWVGFLYATVRAHVRGGWILTAIYSVPFVVVVTSGGKPSQFQGWVMIATWVLSIFQAFHLRSEFLMRLDALQRAAPLERAAMREEIEREHGLAGDVPAQRRTAPRPARPAAPLAGAPEAGDGPALPVQHPAPAHPEVADVVRPPVSASSAPAPRVDVNAATEAELAALPGMGPSLARRAVELRDLVGGFETVEAFGGGLGLSRAAVDALRPRVVVGPRPWSAGDPGSGRRVDY